MRLFNRYLVLLVLAACTVNLLLAFTGQNDIAVYFIINVIMFLIITLLHAYLNPRSRQLLGTISMVFFAGFVVVVAFKIIEML